MTNLKNILALFRMYALISCAILISGCHQPSDSFNKHIAFGDSLYLKNVPSQPGEETWKFIEDLKSPLWTKHTWKKSSPLPLHADLSGGVAIMENYPDPKGLLETAYNDLHSFFSAGEVNSLNGKYIIECMEDKNFEGEAFQLIVEPDRCRIIAGEADGVRRGIFFIEDEMLRLRGPYLPLGTFEKEPVIQRRISRCFFGPIKRPPAMRDELMDTVDYYPDQYLNRLAHEGVNGLWLTIEFRDLVSTSFTPEAGKDAAQRLAKLRKTVEKCLRYGIRTYIFCIEPRAWDADNPLVKRHPEMAGHKRGAQYLFCPMSKTASEYLYESVNKIFNEVPDLGGIINITHGERGTTCLSAVPSISDYKGLIQCPRCSDKEPWEILHASLSAMERGMHDAAPDAELISWLYMPQPQRFVTGDPYSLGEWVYDLPAHTPEGVILQFNFESGVTRQEFGKLLVGGDYWISNPGPSSRFMRIAEIARDHNTPVSAKIQTGNSHEVATVPYVTVPSLLYRKFKAMHELGVSHTMLCWYFGNYPGLMNKAAGELSMAPFPVDEQDFLEKLASVYWKNEDVNKVVKAWEHFRDAYENYPLTNMFQYYGPMHDGPAWPLILKPADAPLSPTWQIGSSITLQPWPPSGDRIGECIGEVLTLEEVVELTRRMTTSWEEGMFILSGLQKKYADEPERLLEIGVARALGIQLRSGYNILNFYLIREKMLRSTARERLGMLRHLERIIRDELSLNEELLALCEKDSRLGFHSEAEGYKYFPEKIRWRMEQLKIVLDQDVPWFKKTIRGNELLFPEYTGLNPQGRMITSARIDKTIGSGNEIKLPADINWQGLGYGSNAKEIKLAAMNDLTSVYFILSDSSTSNTTAGSSISNIMINIEPRRLWPVRRYNYYLRDESQQEENVRVHQSNDRSYVIIRIPYEDLGPEYEPGNPLRVNVRVQKRNGAYESWGPNNPLTSRLMLGSDNPADLGWLIPSSGNLKKADKAGGQ